MTRGDLLGEIGRRLVELKGAEAMWEPDERDDALDLAQQELNRKLRLMRTTSTAATVVDKQDYVLTTDFGLTAGAFMGVIRPGLIYYDGTQDSTPLKLRSLEWLYEHVPNWRNDAAATPRYFFPKEGGLLFNNMLSLYPKTDKAVAGGLRLHHLLKPARMTDDTHQPFNATAGATIQFPSLEPYHYGLVWYSCFLLVQDEDERAARRALDQYRATVAAAKREVFAPEAQDHDAPGIAVVTGYRHGRTW